MKILMVSDVYHPRVNGVSTSIQTYRAELHRRGHKVTLVAPDYGVSSTADDPDIRRMPSRTVIFDHEDRMMKPLALSQLRKRIQREHYDLVHIHTPFLAHYFGVAAARATGVPCVVSYHTYFEEYLYHYIPLLPRGFLRALARYYTVQQCNQTHGVIVPSRVMANVLQNYGVRTTMEILPTGLELENFRHGDGAAFRRQHGIAGSRPLMLYVGRIAHEKNIEFLIHTAAVVRETIPDALLVIAGEGPAKKHLEKMVESSGLENNVMFVGYLDRATVLQDCYHAADVFVFSSKTETQGLVLLEALAAGIPIVALPVMGAGEVLEDASGVKLAQDNVEDFAECVCELLGDKKQLHAFKQDALRTAQSWSIDRYAEQLVRFYETTIMANREKVRRAATA